MTQKPLILAVETSGRLGSVALAAGRQLLAETVFSAPIRHSAEVFPAICNLLSRFSRQREEIEQVYISVGPGSFTGLRVAVAFARHFALATSARVCAVPTLDVIAENCRKIGQPPEHLAVVPDAKRTQVFAAIFAYDGEAYCRTVAPRTPGQRTGRFITRPRYSLRNGVGEKEAMCRRVGGGLSVHGSGGDPWHSGKPHRAVRESWVDQPLYHGRCPRVLRF